jgi:CRISPR-associated endonuclease/helicase Cas3
VRGETEKLCSLDAKSLANHLKAVAEMARSFAEEARPGDAHFAKTAQLAGMLHDLGKYQPKWQRWAREFQRLKTGAIPDKAIAHTDYDPYSELDKQIERQATANCGKRPNHSSTGAQVALDAKSFALALIIGGHHGGLSDVTALRRQIERDRPDKHLAWQAAVAELPELKALTLSGLAIGEDLLQLEMETRFLFSCLVDADRTHTAGQGRESSAWDPAALLENVKASVAKLADKPCDFRVRSLRNEVFDRCLARGEDEPGVFTLTVPTGGGKTLASMAFALNHAAKHGLNRVIVVIPYISIIEQNAAIYREVLGDEVVLEHHSNVEARAGRENESEDPSTLATENWDARIIVTTSVRFLESLFANHPSQCRRVHRIARSVIIL